MNNQVDLFRKGVFAVKAPTGEVLFDTFEETAYSAKATFVRKHNKHFSRAQAEGYQLVEFTEQGTIDVSKPD